MMHTKHFAATRHTGLAFSLLLAIAGCAGSAGSTADAPCDDCGPAVAPPSPEGLGLGAPALDVALSDDPEPSLRASLAAATVRVRPGGDTTLEVRVDRDTFEGEVAVWAEGLPSGIVAEPAVMPGSVPTGRLIIGATEATPVGGPHAFTVVVSASGVEPVEVPARLVVAGAPGSLDATFGEDGIATFEGSVGVNAVAIDGHGRVLLAGQDWDARSMFIERLGSDGALDSAYGEAARTALPEDLQTAGYKMVIEGDRAYVLMAADLDDGRRQDALAVFDESGQPDARFGGNGLIPAKIFGPGEEDASYALAAGEGTVFFLTGERLAAVKSDGQVMDIALPDGVGVSWGMAYANHTLTLGVNDTDGTGPALLERIHTAGGRDARFGMGGMMRGAPAPSADLDSRTFLVALLVDGSGFAGTNRWLAETGSSVGELVRFTPAGQPDESFGEGGRVSVGPEGENMQGLLVDGEARPVAFTRERPSYDGRLRRFTATGQRDRTFGDGGAIDLRALGLNGVRSIAHDRSADRIVICGGIDAGWGCARFWL